jgi:hypothetical protein
MPLCGRRLCLAWLTYFSSPTVELSVQAIGTVRLNYTLAVGWWRDTERRRGIPAPTIIAAHGP